MDNKVKSISFPPPLRLDAEKVKRGGELDMHPLRSRASKYERTRFGVTDSFEGVIFVGAKRREVDVPPPQSLNRPCGPVVANGEDQDGNEVIIDSASSPGIVLDQIRDFAHPWSLSSARTRA